MSRVRLRSGKAAKNSGFTLTEMLLVVALIAVLSGLSGGLYVGTYQRLLVERAARDFLLTAKYARIMAVERQQSYELQLDPNGTGFVLTTSGSSMGTDAAEQVVVSDYYCKPVKFQGEVKFEKVQIGAAESQPGEGEEMQLIIFQPTGSADSAVVQIGDSKTHYSIGIAAPTGKATMYFGTADQVTIGVADLEAERL